MARDTSDRISNVDGEDQYLLSNALSILIKKKKTKQPDTGRQHKQLVNW